MRNKDLPQHQRMRLVQLILQSAVIFQLAIKTTLAQDPCNGVTCSNKGTCNVDSAYTRGYWCECEDGWAGQDCMHIEPSVICNPENIEVVIDRGLIKELEIDDDPKYVYFGKSSAASKCRATATSNTYKLQIKPPFTSCGTQAIQNTPGDDYTFSNTVVWNREVHNNNSVINRDLMLLDFKCIYEDTYTTSGLAALPALNVLHFATEKGEFEVRMRLYSDSTYSSDSEYKQSPTIAIGSYLYVQVDLAHVKDSDLVVTMDRCFASQSSDPNDITSTKHMLVTDRCAAEEDSTVQIRFNGETSDARFKFQMFKWRWSADDVYLHCEVDICNRAHEICTGEGINCKGSGGFRRKRDLEREGAYLSKNSNGGQIVSEGPIHIQMNDELFNKFSSEITDETDDDSTIIFAAITATLLLILAAIGTYIYLRKRRLSLDKMNKKSLDNTQRLTSLKIHHGSLLIY